MSELTSYYYYEDRVITPATHQYRVYHADEADEVIADLEESHKMEVEQLLMEIVKLKGDYAQGLYVMQAKAENEARHHKYKRCLAMALWCDSEMNYWYDGIEMEQCQRFKFYEKWHKRWLELAEKFKSNSTAQ